MDTPKINHISLCAGYGGIDLGLRRILPSLRNLAYCEIEIFPICNLVSKIESGQLDEAPIFTNLKTFNAKPFRGMVDILSGGFPCQPFSHAGKQKGTDDPRHLFPDIERIILECDPGIIFLENVEGIISSKYAGEEDTSVLKYVLERLEKMGYRSTAGIFSAEEIGAPHRRKRVFIAGVRNELPNTRSCGCHRLTTQTQREWGEGEREGGKMGSETTRHNCSSGKERMDNSISVDSGGNSGAVSGKATKVETQIPQSSTTEHTGGNGGKRNKLELGNTEHDGSSATQFTTCGCSLDGGEYPSRPREPQQWWEFPRTIGENEEIITPVGFSNYGYPASLVRTHRNDALRMLGNGVVPDCAAKAFVCLMHELNENTVEDF